MRLARWMFVFFSFAAMTAAAQPVAFPGAQGWGAHSVGGRGGEVTYVSNLNDSGPGSFREALDTRGARTIVFSTGGVIELLSELQVIHPYIYIAAQTAPGDGIVLKNFGLTVFAHDVIIRGLRVRPGDAFPESGPDVRDGISIIGGAHNIIIDHCSVSWASDENLSIGEAGTHSISVQWSILSEGLYGGIHPKGHHSMGVLVTSPAEKISLHHNLFAHNADRNPAIIGNVDHEFVNNTVYNWIHNALLRTEEGRLKIDFSGNYYIPLSDVSLTEIPVNVDFNNGSADMHLHMVDNYFEPGIKFVTKEQLDAIGDLSQFFSSQSVMSAPSTLIRNPIFDAHDSVMAGVGALHPQRDQTDERILADVRDNTGKIVDCLRADIPLDTGFVISATDTTMTYTQFGQPNAYSLASRRIEIIAGKGAGQTRFGKAHLELLDEENLIAIGSIDKPWDVVPDVTSQYVLYAGCRSILGSYPIYRSGDAPSDRDMDGMPDSWEIENNLDPSDPEDRNGMELSALGYTNLEVYLNGLYKEQSTTSVGHERESITQIWPNPVKEVLHIQHTAPIAGDWTVSLYNANGQRLSHHIATDQMTSINMVDVRPGIYFLHIRTHRRNTIERIVVH